VTQRVVVASSVTQARVIDDAGDAEAAVCVTPVCTGQGALGDAVTQVTQVFLLRTKEGSSVCSCVSEEQEEHPPPGALLASAGGVRCGLKERDTHVCLGGFVWIKSVGCWSGCAVNRLEAVAECIELRSGTLQRLAIPSTPSGGADTTQSLKTACERQALH
jgi:hypothetical protein